MLTHFLSSFYLRIIVVFPHSIILSQFNQYSNLFLFGLNRLVKTVNRQAFTQTCPQPESTACFVFLGQPLHRINDVQKVGRIKAFTANDFFRACELGYKALDYNCDSLSDAELYHKYADGRDEGLTGTGYGLAKGPGIDFDDPAAWDQWYFGRRSGGHPWEIIRGGNSTHVDLFVCHDADSLGYRFRLGEISQQEYDELMANAGYYFCIRGTHRPLESVTFYTVLSAAGLPAIINDAEEILARFDGTDYVGIVPHHIIPKYCEDMFPSKYGHVIDFAHVYDDEIAAFGEDIEWLPEPEARFNQSSELTESI